MYIAAFEWSIFRNGEFSSSVVVRIILRSQLALIIKCNACPVYLYQHIHDTFALESNQIYIRIQIHDTVAFDIVGNPIDDIRIRAMVITSPS